MKLLTPLDGIGLTQIAWKRLTQIAGIVLTQIDGTGLTKIALIIKVIHHFIISF